MKNGKRKKISVKGDGYIVGELIAGGNWNNGSNCSSQSRNANNYRWNTNSNIGAQFVTQIQVELNTLAESLSLFHNEAKHKAVINGG